MNLSIPKRFLIITAVLYVGSFMFFLILSYIQFAPKDIDLYFKTGWIINNSMLQFFNYLIPVQCTAVLLTFSVFYPKVKSESGIDILTSKNFNQLVTVIIIILLSLTALFFSGNEILKPGFHEKLDSYSYLTKTGRAYLEQAQKAGAAGKLLEAQNLITRYLAVKPHDQEGTEFYNTINKRIDNQYSTADPEDFQNTDSIDSLELSYNDAIRLARNYLEAEDFYSAYYYAQIASQLAEESQDARQITAEAWTSLSKTAPSKLETEQFSLYSRKKRGTDLLLGHNPIEAYYLFNQLKVEYPSDPDVTKYLNESIKETRKLTYFIDEAENALNFPGINDIFFLNIDNEDIREICFLGKMVTIAEGTFFEDIETISFNSNTGVRRHITAKYSKLIGNHLLLNGIDRENNNIRLYPEYLVSDVVPEFYNTFKLNVNPMHLNGLSTSGNIYKKMSMIELIEFAPVIAGYGWMIEPLYIEMITRVLNPCGFIILSLLMIVLGWKYRRFAGKIPIAGLVFSPVLIYVVTLVSEAYIYAIRILCTWIFLGFGKPAALGMLAASQIILLIAAFLLIAGLSTGDAKTK